MGGDGWMDGWINGREKVGRDQGGLRHNNFMRWVGMIGRVKVEKDLGGLRNDHLVRWVGMDGWKEAGG